VKWFKHDSNAGLDAKLKRLKLKYGMEGYGLYWYLLECIARTVESHNLTFELEEDAELIATDVNIHRDRVEEMMRFMVDQGLFENTEGRITCLKMSTRSDEYTQKILRNSKSVRTTSRPAPDKVPPNRIEEKRIDKKERFVPPTLDELKAHLDAKGYTNVNPEAFIANYEANGWMVGRNKMKCWKSATTKWQHNAFNQPANKPTTKAYL
jgi:hypothetical protein